MQIHVCQDIWFILPIFGISQYYHPTEIALNHKLLCWVVFYYITPDCLHCMKTVNSMN